VSELVHDYMNYSLPLIPPVMHSSAACSAQQHGAAILHP